MEKQKIMIMKPTKGMSIPDYLQTYLKKKLKVIHPKCALEFGTGAGVATRILAEYSDKVVTMETFQEWIDYSKKELKDYKNILFLKGYFDDSIILNQNTYDFVFVDGPKGGVNRIAPFLFAWNSIKSGALCIFDDANQKGVRILFKLLEDLYGIDFRIDNKERGIGEFIKP